MNNRFAHVSLPSVHEDDSRDLYRLYRRVSRRTRSRITHVTPPGELREKLLTMHRPITRELFEARMQTLRSRPRDFQRALASLRSAG